MKDYDTGAESGDDLEEEDFSVWVDVTGSTVTTYKKKILISDWVPDVPETGISSYCSDHLCVFYSLYICSLFPSIVDEKERLSYKREFDRDHQEYKSLQAELDSINHDLADLDRELDRHPEGSPQYLVSVNFSVFGVRTLCCHFIQQQKQLK